MKTNAVYGDIGIAIGNTEFHKIMGCDGGLIISWKTAIFIESQWFHENRHPYENHIRPRCGLGRVARMQQNTIHYRVDAPAGRLAGQADPADACARPENGII